MTDTPPSPPHRLPASEKNSLAVSCSRFLSKSIASCELSASAAILVWAIFQRNVEPVGEGGGGPLLACFFAAGNLARQVVVEVVCWWMEGVWRGRWYGASFRHSILSPPGPILSECSREGWVWERDHLSWFKENLLKGGGVNNGVCTAQMYMMHRHRSPFF